jgi:hypothetical protein
LVPLAAAGILQIRRSVAAGRYPALLPLLVEALEAEEIDIDSDNMRVADLLSSDSDHRLAV